MTELYSYQRDAYSHWLRANYRGIITACTGAGKTLMGIDCLKRYRMDNPQYKCLIVVPSSNVAKHWESDCKKNNLDVPITTYQKAINQMYRGGLKADCLLLDECHRASPEKQSSAILKMNPIHILGLSATPENSVRSIGPICYRVGWDQANVCKFTVHYATYTPSNDEMMQYDKWTRNMQSRANEVSGLKSLSPGRDSKYDFFTIKRRDVCYTFKSRLNNALRLIKLYKDKRTVVYFERNEQIKTIAQLLDAEGIRYAICSQIQDNLKDYEEHRCNILIIAKKLREGFDDPTIEIVLLIAPTTRALSHTQIVGRALRLNPENPNKHAHIIALIADGTSDRNLISHNDFPKSNTDITTIESILALGPGISAINKTGHTLEDYI